MPPSSTLIKAGGAYIEMFLDGSAALAGLREFEARFKAAQAAFGRLSLGGSLGGNVGASVAASLRRGMGNLLTGNTFANMFVNAGQGLARAVHSVFSGSFFARLSRQFFYAGRQLAMGALVTTGIMASLVSLLIIPLREFSRAEQIMGRFRATFQGLVDDANDFAVNLADSIGQSAYDIRDQMAEFFSILRGADFSPEMALEMTKELTMRANDLQAFFDRIQSTTEAMDVLTSAMGGMVVPVQRFGANIRVFNIEQEMMKRGLHLNSVEMSQQELIMARLSVVFEAMATSGIIGQAARELDTLASRMRAAKGTTRDLTIAIGAHLAPLANVLLRTYQLLGPAVKTWIDSNGSLILGISAASIAFTAFVGVVTVVGVATLALGANFRLMQIGIVALMLPMKILFGVFKIAAVVFGGFVLAAQLTAGAFRLLFSSMMAAARMGAAIATLAIHIAAMGKALVVATAGGVITGAWSLVKFFVQLGVASVVAAKGVVSSIAAITSHFLIMTAALLGKTGVLVTTILVKLFFNTIISEVPKVLSAFSSLGALAGNVLTSIASLAVSAATSFGGLVSAIFTLVATFAAFFAPVVALGLAIGGIGTALYNVADQIQAGFVEIGKAAQVTFRAIVTNASAAWSVLVQGFQTLKADAVRALQGIGDAIAAGNLRTAVQTLWAFIQLEFARGWATIAPLWVQFGQWLFTTANSMWSSIRQVFAAGFIEIQGLALSIVATMNALGASLAAGLKSIYSTVISFAQIAAGDLTGVWDSNESAIIQIAGIIENSLVTASVILRNVWDEITTALERAKATLVSMVNPMADLAAELRAIDQASAARQQNRGLAAQNQMAERRVEREKLMAEVKAAKEAARARIEEEERLRQERINEMFSGTENSANEQLAAAQKNFNDLLEQARKQREEAGADPGVAGVMSGFQKMVDEFFNGQRKEAGLTTQISEAKFSGLARFGLGAVDVQTRQLNELTRIRELSEQQLRKPPVQIAQPVVGQ